MRIKLLISIIRLTDFNAINVQTRISKLIFSNYFYRIDLAIIVLLNLLLLWVQHVKQVCRKYSKILISTVQQYPLLNQCKCRLMKIENAKTFNVSQI